MDVNQTLEQRGSRYGEFEDVATVTHQLYQVISGAPSYNDLPPIQKEAYNMIFSKIARSVCGDPTYTDNIHDIVGYAKLLEDYLIKTNGE